MSTTRFGRDDRRRGALGRGDAFDDLGRQLAEARPIDVVSADDALGRGRPARVARRAPQRVAPTTRSRAVATSMPQSRHAARNRPIGNRSVPCSSKCRRYPSAASCSTASRWRASSWSSSAVGLDRRDRAIGVERARAILRPPLCGACAPRPRLERPRRAALTPPHRGNDASEQPESGAGTERDESGPASGTGWRYG